MPKSDKTRIYSDGNKTTTYNEESRLTKSTVHNIIVGDKLTLNRTEYSILELISESTGEAIIYKVKTKEEKIYALKLYYEYNNPDNEPNTEALTRIKDIKDEDILRLIDFGTGVNKYKGKFCFEISDFAFGHDLLHVKSLKEKYNLDFIVQEIIPQIFKGILKLHDNKIYHCDLKPQNVFYLDKEQEEVVIGDYGSAKTFEFDAAKTSRKTTTVKGTDFYLPPEQARGFISEKNDYYSFGMILLHLFYPEKILLDENVPKSLSHSKLKQIIERQFEAKSIIDFDPQFKRINSLIEGLTLVDFNQRWGKEQVEQWLEGKDIAVDYLNGYNTSRHSVNSNTLIFGKYTINSVYDLRDYILNDANWYADLIEDKENREEFIKWMLKLFDGDRSKRSALNRIIKYYSQEGIEFIADAIIRFFIPEHPVLIGFKSFDFANSNDLMKTTAEAFTHLLFDLWENSSDKDIKLYVFRYEFALWQLNDKKKEAYSALNKLYHNLKLKGKLKQDFYDYQVFTLEVVSSASVKEIKLFLYDYLPSVGNIEFIGYNLKNELSYYFSKSLTPYLNSIGIEFPLAQEKAKKKLSPLLPKQFDSLEDYCEQSIDNFLKKTCRANSIEKDSLTKNSVEKFKSDFKSSFTALLSNLSKEYNSLKKQFKNEEELDVHFEKLQNILVREYNKVFNTRALINGIKKEGKRIQKSKRNAYLKYKRDLAEQIKRQVRILFRSSIFFILFLFVWPIIEIKNTLEVKDMVLKGVEIKFVKGGTFKMGRNNGNRNERPAHTVTLDDFYIGKYEVTNAQFAQFLNEYKSLVIKSGIDSGKSIIELHAYNIQKLDNIWVAIEEMENKPVISVSWFGANEFCKWADARLPTEAEWEFAARGGVKSKGYKFSGSDILDSVAWNKNQKYIFLGVVGIKMSNELGIHDMNGNVWEWCEDWYNARYYRISSKKNPCNTKKPTYEPKKVVRGGAYYSDKKQANPYHRWQQFPKSRQYYQGFRICWENDYIKKDNELSALHDKTLNNRPRKKNNNITSSQINRSKKRNFEMVLIKGGTFAMGNKKGGSLEYLEHEVTLNEFYISNLEITNEQYCKFLNEYGSDTVKSGGNKGKLMIEISSKHPYSNWGIQKVGDNWMPIPGYERFPVIFVSWFGANEYCKWAGGRLPTEAEWEYAAIGAKKSRSHLYSGSNSAWAVSWNKTNSGEISHPVGTKRPNALGIYDMSGNVWEWCEDSYSKYYYKRSPKSNPCLRGEGASILKCIRGGSYSRPIDLAKTYRRNALSPYYTHYADVGFRMARSKQ